MRKHLKNYFIPSEENNHKPHSLQKQSVMAILGFVFLIEFAFLASLFSPIAGTLKNNLAAVLPSVLVMATNEERKEIAAPALQSNTLLKDAAQLKADDMARRSFFSHVNPDGKQPWYYIDLAGYKYEAAGENLAVDFVDSDDVHEAWMNSPTHKANIIQPKFSEIGIATSRGKYEGKGVVFVVQFFAKPKYVAPQSAPAFVTPQAEPSNEESAVLASSKEIEVEEIDSSNISESEIAVQSTTSRPQVLGFNDTKEPEEISVSPEDDESVVTSVEESVVQEKELSEEKTILENNEPSISEVIASKPHTVSKMLIYMALCFVILAIVLKVVVKKQIQHKDLLINGIALLSVILLLLAFNTVIISRFGAVL